LVAYRRRFITFWTCVFLTKLSITRINAIDKISITSGRDTNVRGAEVAGNTVDANVGRDLNIASQQDTNTYDSKQTSAGFQMSLCIPPICYGTTVQGSASVSDQTIKDRYQSVNQQSGFFAGNGGYNINVGNHTQLDGGAIASTAGADRNTLSTQTFGFTNLQNTASYSGSTLGFSASGAAGMSTPDGVSFTPPVKAANNAPGPANSAGFGPSGFGAAGTGSDASGTTYAAVSQGKITVRGDAGTGRDSTEGLSRDTANANGSVQNTFDAQQVGNDMAIQQATAQVGMQVVGDVATALESSARDKVKGAQARLDAAKAAGDDAGAQQAQADLEAAKTQLTLWANDGAARIGAHAVVAGVGAALGGGNVLGAVGGTVAGDVAGNAVSRALLDTLGSNILSNAVAGMAGAVVGGALGGSAGAMSGANGALGADLYNRQLHRDEKEAIHAKANGDTAEEERLTQAACYRVQCWSEYSPNNPAWLANYVSPMDAQNLKPELDWVDNHTVAGGLFDYTTLQRGQDTASSQWDKFSRGVQQIVQDAKNLPHDVVSQFPRVGGGAQQGDANPQIDPTGGGTGTPPTPAVVTPSMPVMGMTPMGPAPVGATPSVVVPGTPILSSGSGNDESSSGSQISNQNGSSSNQQTTNNGSLSGTPTQIPPLSDAVTARSLTLENQSATVLADRGYDVVQNPVVPGPKNPDYLINGAIFDNYAPSTGNVRNIASNISDKVTGGQASNIVVNLTDSSATPAALQTQLTNYPVPGLKQVIVIDQSGAVIKLNIKGN
jgi:filamentous hemagglutinin